MESFFSQIWSWILTTGNLIVIGILGLLAGLIAKWIMPGKDPGGIIVTMLIGIAGAYLGKFIAVDWLHLIQPGGITNFLIAIGGALVILIIYRLIFGKSKS